MIYTSTKLFLYHDPGFNKYSQHNGSGSLIYLEQKKHMFYA